MSTLTAQEKKDRTYGIFGTMILHVLLLLLFLLWKFNTSQPIPETDEGGSIVINFGESETGLGEKPVQQPGNTSENKNQETKSQEIPSVNNIKTQNTEEAPFVKTSEKPEVKELQPSSDVMSALSKLNNKNSNSNSTQGITQPGGDQGKPWGDPNSNNYSQGPPGPNTWKVSEPGRKMIEKPVIIDDSQETGSVVVEIIIDKTGKIKRAKAVVISNLGGQQFVSSATNQYLWKRAEDGVMKAKFNASPAGSDDVKGVVIVNFIVK